ncbi:MAG: hypothetical protein M3Q48_04920 [Actinomycetota bacterium]|nr:hypothetical protein [Actinomycetota bacterium]
MVGGAVALWGLAIGLEALSDNSALTHLATGRLILDEGIPRRDPFSFTGEGRYWTVYSWLASAGMALADRAAGGHGIIMARAALTTGIAVVAWRLTRPAGALGGRIIAVTVVLVVGTGSWPERPLLIALAIFAALVLVTEAGGSPLLAAGGMWLWVNVHGSFPFGLVYLVVRLAGRRLDRAPLGALPPLVLGAVAGTLAGAVNPLGPRLLVFPFELLARHDLLDRVQEWQPPDFSRPTGGLFLVAFVTTLVLAGRRRSWEDSLSVGVFGLAGCLAQRNLSLASLVFAPVMARSLAGLGTIRGERRSVLTLSATAVLVMVGSLLVAASLQRPAYRLVDYPVRQLDWMDEQGLLAYRVATQDFVGNLIIARRGIEADVFYDDRYDLYPREVIKDSLALLDGQEGWQRRLDKYGIDVVLWERTKPLAEFLALDAGWVVVRKDPRWVIAVREGSRAAAGVNEVSKSWR